MLNSCRSVPASYPPTFRQADKEAMRNASHLLDNAAKYLGEEISFGEDKHGRGNKEHHNG